MDTDLILAGIEEESIVDGPGLRITIFTQGCYKNCPGCHNPHTHDPAGGKTFSLSHILELYRQNPLLVGMTFSGGEPFLQAAPLSRLARNIHSLGGDIVTYSGYYYEELLELAKKQAAIGELLEETDLLIDGPFLQERRNLELSYRGSDNQRILSKMARKELYKHMMQKI